MEKRKINLSDILQYNLAIHGINIKCGDEDYQVIIKSMKEACRQTLELATENAETWCYAEGNEPEYGVDKQSILNTINQIE